MSEETYPTLVAVDTVQESRYSTEGVAFETGYSTTRALWNHPMARFELKYPILFEAQYRPLMDFWMRHRGGYDAFRYDDPLNATPTLRQFGVGDGFRTQFKLPHDYNTAPTIYVDGVEDTAVYVNPETGRVMFGAAPADGASLTYSATDCGYRVRFANDPVSAQSLKYSAWEVSVALEQVVENQDEYPVSQCVFSGTRGEHVLAVAGDAISFSFLAPKTMTVATVWCYRLSAGNGDLIASICENTAGAPGNVLGTGTGATGDIAYAWTKVDLSTPYEIQAGVRYWLVWTLGAPALETTIAVRTTLQTAYRGQPQDDFLYGGYVIADRKYQNTPDSWLGTAIYYEGGSWTERDPTIHGVFVLDGGADGFVLHSPYGLATQVYGAATTQVGFTVATTHDMVIDTIGGVFSTAVVPADDLEYKVWVNGVLQASGTLDAAENLSGVPTPMEARLSAPVTLAVGDAVVLQFLSPSSLVGNAWTHYGYDPSHSQFGTDFDADWLASNWAGSASTSGDFLAATPSVDDRCYTVRCRGWYAA